MFNATIIGHVGADAELRYLADGKPVLNFRLATTRKRKTGETTTWVSASFFGPSAEKIVGYVLKGKQVGVSGEVHNRQYEKDGQPRYSLEIEARDVQLLGKPEETTNSTAPRAATAAYVPAAEEAF